MLFIKIVSTFKTFSRTSHNPITLVLILSNYYTKYETKIVKLTNFHNKLTLILICFFHLQ